MVCGASETVKCQWVPRRAAAELKADLGECSVRTEVFGMGLGIFSRACDAVISQSSECKAVGALLVLGDISVEGTVRRNTAAAALQVALPRLVAPRYQYVLSQLQKL